MVRIHRKRLDSSSMNSMGYDPLGKLLDIEYPSRDVYRYFEVPPSEYENFMNAPSKGTYLNQQFKPAGYRYEIVAKAA
jgi:hypothetical protein